MPRFSVLPDFEPNTCSVLLSDAVAESVNLLGSDGEVEAAVQKTLGCTQTPLFDPSLCQELAVNQDVLDEGLD